MLWRNFVRSFFRSYARFRIDVSRKVLNVRKMFIHFRTCYYLPNLLRLFERNVLNGRGMNIEGRNDLVHWGGDYTGKRNRERGCRLRRSMTFVGRGIGIERRKLMKSLSNWFDIIVKKRRFWLKHE